MKISVTFVSQYIFRFVKCFHNVTSPVLQKHDVPVSNHCSQNEISYDNALFYSQHSCSKIGF